MNFSAKKMFFIDLLITIIGVLFDQFTKHLAVLRLKDQAPVSLIPGALELRYLENRGAAFGILQNQKIFFVLINLTTFFMFSSSLEFKSICNIIF